MFLEKLYIVQYLFSNYVSDHPKKLNPWKLL